MHKRDVKTIIERAVPEARVRSVKRLGTGNINEMWEAALEQGPPVLLRLYGESWKARKEAYVYGLIRKHTDVPVPEVRVVDDSCALAPRAFTILSKLPGTKIRLLRKDASDLYAQAGRALARIHKIPMERFGWIVGEEIKPSFRSWGAFVDSDMKSKVARVRHLIKDEEEKVWRRCASRRPLLEITAKPVLVHRDFHGSHILVDKGRLSGIIDVEWALAGHAESDLIKLELWDFADRPAERAAFFRGYGALSKDYEKRRDLYELWHRISMINISFELGRRDWLAKNVAGLRSFLR